jgi:hypothetical protein
MKAERVNPLAAAAWSMASSNPASSDRLAFAGRPESRMTEREEL